MVRLDAQVSSLFGVKQSEARALIASGEVSVNGAPQREPRWQVVLGEEATVTVGGRAPPTGRPFAHRLLLVHKPRGVLSERRRGSAAWNAAHGRRSGEAHGGGAHAEAERRTVWDLVPVELRHASLGVFGRLDADTTGLILMGTDGGVQSLLMHPSCGCQKSYLAHLRTDRGDLRLRASTPEDNLALALTLALALGLTLTLALALALALTRYAALLGADSEAALLLQARIRARGVGVRARSG